MFEINEAYLAASKLDVTFDKFTIEEFLGGMNIELENGNVEPLTNVTDDELITTSKIVLAHLNEYSDYYNPVYGLRTFEEFLKTKL